MATTSSQRVPACGMPSSRSTARSVSPTRGCCKPISVSPSPPRTPRPSPPRRSHWYLHNVAITRSDDGYVSATVATCEDTNAPQQVGAHSAVALAGLAPVWNAARSASGSPTRPDFAGESDSAPWSLWTGASTAAPALPAAAHAEFSSATGTTASGSALDRDFSRRDLDAVLSAIGRGLAAGSLAEVWGFGSAR